MKTVFISGSSKIKRLNKEMTDCMNEFNTDFRTFDIKEIHG